MAARSTVERRDKIIQLLYNNGKARVDELSEKFQVTSVTIRNDLDFLEQKGILYRSHGGAILRKNVYKDPSIEEKQKLNQEEKQRIVKRAAQMIAENDNILLDSGTTTTKIAHNLLEETRLTIMTNAVNIALDLAGNENVKVMLTGGVIRQVSNSLVGPEAENTIRNYYFDKLFLGVDGLHLEEGITTPNPLEAQLNRLMVSRANKVIVVADSSKFGKLSFSHICPIDAIDTIVTDSGITSDVSEEINSMGINLITV